MNDVGLFLSRAALGAGIAAHGAQKAFGAFDGPGPAGAAMFMESLGFTPGRRFATAAAWTELAGGSLMVLGLGGPAGPAALISTMVVAQSAVHAKNGFFAQKNGIELGLMYAAGALALASAGYGRFSLDETLGWHKLRDPWVTALAIMGGVAAGTLILAQRVAPAPPPTPVNEEALNDAHDHIAAAREDRPVPADLLASEGSNATPPA
jgi:putative oxidoreductase